MLCTGTPAAYVNTVFSRRKRLWRTNLHGKAAAVRYRRTAPLQPAYRAGAKYWRRCAILCPEFQPVPDFFTLYFSRGIICSYILFNPFGVQFPPVYGRNNIPTVDFQSVCQLQIRIFPGIQQPAQLGGVKTNFRRKFLMTPPNCLYIHIRRQFPPRKIPRADADTFFCSYASPKYLAFIILQVGFENLISLFKRPIENELFIPSNFGKVCSCPFVDALSALPACERARPGG